MAASGGRAWGVALTFYGGQSVGPDKAFSTTGAKPVLQPLQVM